MVEGSYSIFYTARLVGAHPDDSDYRFREKRRHYRGEEGQLILRHEVISIQESDYCSQS